MSADGRYRGKYQFSRATWRALGGKGDPAKAPEARQDRLAASCSRCSRHLAVAELRLTGQLQRITSARPARIRSTRAGAPAPTELAGRSFVTTEFVPTTQLSPTVAPRRMHAA